MQIQKTLPVLLVLAIPPSSVLAQSVASIASASSKPAIEVAGVPFSKTATIRDGTRFVELRVSVSGSNTYAVDLTKVFLKGSGQQHPVVGLSISCGRSETDAAVFSMLTEVALKDGGSETQESILSSFRNIDLKYHKGGPAQLTVSKPPATVCLVFVVPTSEQLAGGNVVGLTAQPLKVPNSLK